MEIRYLLHAMFALTANGTTIVIDPWNDDIGHPRPSVTADAVLLTHEHFDHTNVGLVGGSPRIVRALSDEGTAFVHLDERIGPFQVTSVPAYHDAERGAARGKIGIVVIEAEGVRLVHLSDLGHRLTPEQVRAIGRADLVMIPVGGHFTCDHADVDAVIEQLGPRVVVPMHFKTDANAGWPISTLDAYLQGRPSKRIGARATVTADALPAARETWVML